MHKKISKIAIFGTFCLATAPTLGAPKTAGTWKTLTSWVQGVTEEERHHQADMSSTTKMVKIEHIGGALTINFWKKPSILIDMTIRGTEESRTKTGLKTPLGHEGGTTTIATYTDAEDPSTIDATITLPETVALSIVNSAGALTIEKPIHEITATLNSSDVTITNPQAAITATIKNGAIEIPGAQGKLTLALDHGKITLNNPQAAVATTGKSGTLDITGAQGELTLILAEGTLSLKDPRDAASVTMHQGTVTIDGSRGALDLSIHNGQVDIVNSQSPNVRATVGNGNILLEQQELKPSTSIFIQAGRDITVALPPATRAELVANTTKGMVTSELLCTLQVPPLRLTKEEWKRMPGHVHGMLGPRTTEEAAADQCANITLESDKGNITIEKL
jgi:hypothetical protein